MGHCYTGKIRLARWLAWKQVDGCHRGHGSDTWEKRVRGHMVLSAWKGACHAWPTSVPGSPRKGDVLVLSLALTCP